MKCWCACGISVPTCKVVPFVHPRCASFCRAERRSRRVERARLDPALWQPHRPRRDDDEGGRTRGAARTPRGDRPPARAIAVDTPGVDDEFRLPRGSGDQRLIETARQFAHDAAPLVNDFVKHAIPPNFLDDLGSDIKALEDAVEVRESGEGIHLAAVRRLDAIVPNTVGHDAATLALREHARRVDYPWSRRKVEEQEDAAEEPTALTTPDQGSAPVASPATATTTNGVTA